MRRVAAVGLWPLRVAWLGAAVAMAPAVTDALDGSSTAVRWVTAVGLYAAWAAGLLATLVPRTIGLTGLRVGGPAALAVAGWAAAAGGPPAVSDVVALAWATLVAALALAGTTADAMVDGSSYGAERRFALRTPLVVLLGPAELAWLAVVGGLAAGPLLLAAEQWVLGLVALAVGLALAALGARALHQLSRRWVVFVPAGVVLHDPTATTDPALFPRPLVVRLGPAPAGETVDGDARRPDRQCARPRPRVGAAPAGRDRRPPAPRGQGRHRRRLASVSSPFGPARCWPRPTGAGWPTSRRGEAKLDASRGAWRRDVRRESHRDGGRLQHLELADASAPSRRGRTRRPPRPGG